METLMMIEPQGKSIKIRSDELVEMGRRVFAQAKPTRIRYRGIHRCSCGKVKENRDWFLPGHIKVSCLMVHYLEEHRDEIPQEEIDKLRRIDEELKRKHK